MSAGFLSHDPHDGELLRQVRPSGWANPQPAGRYNLVVVGGGTAGLVAAVGAAGLGAKTALVEKNWLGGDCLNFGCVPSKTLIRAAHAAHAARAASHYGIRTGTIEVDFAQVMTRVREIRARLSPHDSADRLKKLGVDVFFGAGKFLSPNTLEVAGQKLDFAKAVLATGARAALPPIPGLAEAGVLTNESVFNLTRLPARLAVIGGGPIGCELAQSFQRLGSSVTLFDQGRHVLPREDADAAEAVQQSLKSDGVEFVFESRLEGITRSGDIRKIHFRAGSDPSSIRDFDEILVAAGRQPNVDGMGLQEIGIATDARAGIQVDDHLRTSVSNIYASGDCCSRFQFTHAADAMSRMVLRNALFGGRRRTSALTIPWCTYTDPEIAQVGLNEARAKESGVPVQVFVRQFSEVDRARTEGETSGFVKILVRSGSDRIVGATIVGKGAGELISEVGVAMAGGVGLGRLAEVIHPYPTRAEALRQCGDSYNRTRLTPGIKNWMSRWLAWSRR